MDIQPSANSNISDTVETQIDEIIILQSSVVVILWLLSVIGNCLVCFVIYRSRRVQSTTNYFVVSLACTDLALSGLWTPFIFGGLVGGKWTFGQVMCKTVMYANHALLATSMFVFVCICIDRFYTIIYPLSFKVTRGTAKKMLIGSWILAFILPVALLYFTTTKDDACVQAFPSMPNGAVYFTVMVILTFGIPSAIISTVYTRIAQYIWRPGSGDRLIQRTNNPVPRAKVKIVKMLIITTLVNICLTMPYYVVQLIRSHSQVTKISQPCYIAVTLLVIVSTDAKSMIYFVYNSNFRRGCQEVCCLTKTKCYRSNAYAVTTASKLDRKNCVDPIPTIYYELSQVQNDISQVFNRATHVEKTAWPLDISIVEVQDKI